MPVARAIVHGLARSRRLQAVVSRCGLHPDGGFVRRFVAGESPHDAIVTARRLARAGFAQSLAYLGADTTTMASADAATRACVRMLPEIADAGVDRHLSVSLTHYGLLVDRATAIDNLRRLLEAARPYDFLVYVDMEDARRADTTFEIVETLLGQDYRNTGVAVQASLLRSPQDVERLNRRGARVRLVKGAFRESRKVGHRSKARVDTAYIALAEQLLRDGTAPAFATHDPPTIARIVRLSDEWQVPPARFEFHLLHGVRPDLQAALARDGYTVRVVVPFGPEWFPYLMRRVGERPANIGFLLRSLLRERRDATPE